MDTDCSFRLLTGGGKSLRHPTQNKIILQGEQIICVTTVTLRRIGRSSELLDYSLLEALLKVYSFEFAVLQPNSTGCNESKSRGILSIRELFRRKPLQLFCLRIWWRQVRETFLMLGPTICNDIWTSLISWKSDRCRRSFEISPIQVSVSWYRK